MCRADARNGRPRKYAYRAILNGIFYADTLPCLKKVWADGGSTGKWADFPAERYGDE